MEYITFNNGRISPVLGLGTFQITTTEPLRTALDIGYRHFDSAVLYSNGDVIGQVMGEYITNGRLKREDVFITSKLSPINMEKKEVALSLKMELQMMNLEYVDLFLIHIPFALKKNEKGEVTWPTTCKGDGGIWLRDVDLTETWKGMEDCVHLGLAKSIGLSNFNIEQTEKICRTGNILPVTNQVEAHPYLPQSELQKVCDKYGVVITAYSPFGSPQRPDIWINDPEEPRILEEPLIGTIATKYEKTPAQIVLRYLLQRNMIVIPKSANPQRQRENLNVFDFRLTDADMEVIRTLGKQHFRYLRFLQISEHPQYPWRNELTE